MSLTRLGVTLVELALVIVLTGILAATVPIIVLHGVRASVFLPKSLATNHVAAEILHAVVEGGQSTLQPEPVLGLRYAAREQLRRFPDPAIWLAEESRIGYLIPHDPLDPNDNEYVVLRLDAEVVKRAVYTTLSCPPPPTAEEILPYDADGVRVITTGARPLFRYFDEGGGEMGVLGCTDDPELRRVDVAFVAQTGAGEFDQGDARVDVMSSVAIRFP